MVAVSNVKRRHDSKSTTKSLGTNIQDSDSTPPTAKRSVKTVTTKNPPPWLQRRIDEAKAKSGLPGARRTDADYQVKNIQNKKEKPNEREYYESEKRSPPPREDGGRHGDSRGKEKEGEEARREVLKRRLDEFKKPGATASKAFSS